MQQVTIHCWAKADVFVVSLALIHYQILIWDRSSLPVRKGHYQIQSSFENESWVNAL